MPLVSVIIPLYNYEKYIENALKSVLSQSLTDYEVVVVDDGSTDNSPRILGRYNNQINIIRQENRGLSAARNKGIMCSAGEYIAFLDADDVWLRDKLQKQIEVLRRSPDLGMVGCGYHIIDSEGNVVKEVEGFTFENSLELLEKWKIHNVPCGSGSGMIVRRGCFDSVGLFDESLESAEDRDMWFRIGKLFNAYIIKEPLVQIRSHANNMHKNISRMKNNQKTFIKKNLGEEKWVIKRKAYGYVYLDAAHEYYALSNRCAAFANAMASICYYPFRVSPEDDKYKLLLKTIINY
jgi:glycosyltransferase involved in cell wall biosynthesis